MADAFARDRRGLSDRPTGPTATRAIAKALAEHGRAGVPLYLVYRPGRAEPQVLPQLLTPGVVEKALN